MNLSNIGSVCSILGLILSIWLLVRTKKIQDNVDNALEHKNRIVSYGKKRAELLNELTECMKFFLVDHDYDEQKPYIERLDLALAEALLLVP